MKYNVLLPSPRAALTEQEANATVYLYGKPYHWTLNNGFLKLKPGRTEYEQVRHDIWQRFVDKGVPPTEITRDMVENVLNKAVTAAQEELFSE